MTVSPRRSATKTSRLLAAAALLLLLSVARCCRSTTAHAQGSSQNQEYRKGETERDSGRCVAAAFDASKSIVLSHACNRKNHSNDHKTCMNIDVTRVCQTLGMESSGASAVGSGASGAGAAAAVAAGCDCDSSAAVCSVGTGCMDVSSCAGREGCV